MLKKQRHQMIIEYLEVHRFAKIDELSKKLEVSEITIRRDINDLDSQNKVKKVYGGASSLEADSLSQDIDLKFREGKFHQEKIKITEKASEYIKENKIIYLDAGSTVHCLIAYLKDYNLTVYTHGMHHLEALSQLDIKTYVIGGLLKRNTFASVGGMSLEILANLSFDIAFMGFNGLDLDFGYSTPDELEASVKRKIIQQSREVYFLGDKSKFNLRTGVKFADISDGVLISNAKISEKEGQIEQIIY